MADASDDEFISELEDKFGLEGYARWWKLLEIIAKQMDGTDKCSAEYSWVKWQSFLKGKRNKLETFLEHSQNKLKINLEQNGNILKISCPKLLELRDEYSRKSGHTPDTTPDNVAPEGIVIVRSKEVSVVRDKPTRTKIPIELVEVSMVQGWASDNISKDIDIDRELLKFHNHVWKKKPPDDGVRAFRNWLIKAQEFKEKDKTIDIRNGRYQDKPKPANVVMT